MKRAVAFGLLGLACLMPLAGARRRRHHHRWLRHRGDDARPEPGCCRCVDYYFISQMFEQLVRRESASSKRVNWLAES